ncbi:MAG: TolC family protein [Pirellulaceae bacterium]
MRWIRTIVASVALIVAPVALFSECAAQSSPTTAPSTTVGDLDTFDAYESNALNIAPELALPEVPQDLQFTLPATSPPSPIDQPIPIDQVIGQPASSLEAVEPFQSVPTLTRPWWSDALSHPTQDTQDAFVGRAWELENLIWLAVEHSPYIQSVLVEPQIQNAKTWGASAQFDPNAFVDSIFHDTSDPVGNTLITGSAPRLNELNWDSRSGIRAKNSRGGQAEFSQQFQFKDSNSDFFVPGRQADTKMLLRYTQPLIRGRGQAYNRASIVIASLAANQSHYEVSAKIQQHAYEITAAYWELYTARASHAQIDRGLVRLRDLKEQLVGRVDLDSLRSQLLRADAAIARQEANLAQSFSQIVAAEAKLRSAVAAPELRDRSLGDVIPVSLTADWLVEIQQDHELSQALDNRPEVQAIRANLQSARVRLNVAEHELRPTLDLVLEGYLRGLNGDYDAAKSFGDQFSEGAPSYSAGVAYVRPYRNTAARAILQERRLELRRELLQLDHTLLTISAEVESSIARVSAAYQQLESAVRTTIATHAELEYLKARWQNAFLDGTSTSLLLDQLLNAEVQLIQSENAWARAQADHMIATAAMQLSTGTLLSVGVGSGE